MVQNWFHKNMISSKLKTLFLISIPIFIGHGFEEYFTGFYNVDPSFKFVFHFFETMSMPQATFLVYQILLLLSLVILAFVVASDMWRLRLMVIPGLFYIFELDHFWQAFLVWGYYPGVITAIAFPIIGFLYWKELLRNFRKS